MTGFVKCRLDEVADLSLGKMLDAAKNKGAERPYLANVNVRWGEFDLSEPRTMRFEDRELARFGLKAGDIVMCEGGEPGRCAIWKDDVPGMMFQKALHRVRVKAGVDHRFLYYALLLKGRSDGFQHLFTGATIKHLPAEKLRLLEIDLPTYEVQSRIADRLSSIDDLIDNNRRRIKLLEDSVRLLFDEWFVRLRFPGHASTAVVDGVPHGWSRKPLRESAVLHYGKALKADVRAEAGTVPVYGSSGIVGTHDKALVKGPGIIVGRKGNVGSVFWSSCDFYPIDTVYFLDAATSDLYLHCALQRMQFISTDVAVPGLNRDLAYSRPLLAPPGALRSQFLDIAVAIHAQIDTLAAMNEKLRAARDLLLPRLMSGEIEV